MAVQSVSMNAAMNLMTISSADVGSVEKMLRQLTYVNDRLFPTPASRPLTVETHIKSAIFADFYLPSAYSNRYK